MNETIFKEEDVISTYTEKQAEDDGILVNIIKINKKWEKGLFNYVTTNLMNKGYMDLKKEKLNIPCILDLLNCANYILKTKSNNFKDFDTFFSGRIELPNGQKQEIFICQNSTGKFTIMLPEDY